MISRKNKSDTFTDNISSSFRCSKGAGVSVHLEFLGDSYLVGSSGRPYMVLPTWALVSLGLGLSSLLRLCAGQISYFEPSQLHSLIVVFSHLLSVFFRSVGGLLSYFIQAV